MKETLQQVEFFLQTLIEDSTYRLLGTKRTENILVTKLTQSLENKLRLDSQNNIIAPNIFSLNVPAEYFEDIRSNQRVIDELSGNLLLSGKSAGIHFNGAITINIFPDETLNQGEFNVEAIWKDNSLSSTTSKMASNEFDLASSILPPKAFLIVGGTQIFTLEQDVINIGRSNSNHLVLDDPRISRKHAQLRVIKGRHMLFDLDSAGGTYVNSKRITQVTLHPGDVISLASVPLVYGQDTANAIDDTQEYSPPSTNSNASTTTLRFSNLDSNLPADTDPIHKTNDEFD